MSQLSIPRTVLTGNTFTQQNNEDQCAAIETFLNSTKLTGTDNIQSGAIVSSNFAAGAVDTTALGNAAVTTAKIADSNVTTAKIADANVTTAKIADSNVTTAKIADGSVTQAKRASLGLQITGTCGNYQNTGTTYQTVTNLAVDITTTGRPVFIGLISDGGSSESNFGSSGSGTVATGVYRILRNGSVIAVGSLPETNTSTGSTYMPPSLFYIDVPPAGSYDYAFQVKNQASNSIAYVSNCKLLAYEL